MAHDGTYFIFMKSVSQQFIQLISYFPQLSEQSFYQPTLVLNLQSVAICQQQ